MAKRKSIKSELIHELLNSGMNPLKVGCFKNLSKIRITKKDIVTYYMEYKVSKIHHHI